MKFNINLKNDSIMTKNLKHNLENYNSSWFFPAYGNYIDLMVEIEEVFSKTIKESIGPEIKEARKNCELSQSQLADYTKVSQDTISLWELGKRIPDLVDIFKIDMWLKSDILNDIDYVQKTLTELMEKLHKRQDIALKLEDEIIELDS